MVDRLLRPKLVAAMRPKTSRTGLPVRECMDVHRPRRRRRSVGYVDLRRQLRHRHAPPENVEIVRLTLGRVSGVFTIIMALQAAVHVQC